MNQVWVDMELSNMTDKASKGRFLAVLEAINTPNIPSSEVYKRLEALTIDEQVMFVHENPGFESMFLVFNKVKNANEFEIKLIEMRNIIRQRILDTMIEIMTMDMDEESEFLSEPGNLHPDRTLH